MLCCPDDVAAICRERVNISLLSANNHTLCVDGTSCTKKTTILTKASKRFDTTFTKIQHNYKVRNPDSYFPSMLGYMCDGVMAMLRGRPHFNDRSPTNVLEWHFLWSVMDNFVQLYGNVRPSPKMHEASLKLYRQVFEQLKLTDYYKLFRNRFNCITMVDSNLDRCDALHLRRNESTDAERGTWRFYTPLQNLMYEILYEGLCIDLAWFDEYILATDSDDCIVRDGIALFYEETLDYLCKNRTVDRVPLEDCRLLTPSNDYYLSNITTHVYRSIGRWGCKRIHAENLSLGDAGEDVSETKQRRLSLSSHIPDALCVENITNHKAITGKTARHLVMNDSPTDIEIWYANAMTTTTSDSEAVDESIDFF